MCPDEKHREAGSESANALQADTMEWCSDVLKALSTPSNLCRDQHILK